MMTVCLSLVFVLAVGVWYSSALFKGYAPYTLNANTILARNFYLTGKYSLENDKNVLLAPDLIESEGQVSSRGNKFTSLFYGYLFKLTGLPSADNLVLLSIIIHALTLLILTVLVLSLFNLKVAAVFSLVYILLPFNWQLPYGLADYEFGLFFLSLFLLLFFMAGKRKHDYIYLGLAGVFLALTCISVEALMLISPFLFVFLWLKKQKRFLLYIFVPFAILFTIFWLPNLRYNSYMKLFFNQKNVKTADFSYYSHLYPDPYTYYFEREEFLSNLKKQISEGKLDAMEELDRLKELRNMGESGLGFFDRTKVSLVIASRHLFRFVSLEEIGGPFVLFLILLGLYALREKNRYLYHFFISWISMTIFLMAFIVLAVRNHLADFPLAIALLISLGLLALAKLIVDCWGWSGKKAFLVYLFILFTVLYNFVVIDHVAWSRVYDNSENLKVQAYSQEVKKVNVLSREVIAANLVPNSICSLNYLTDKSIVYFSSGTIKKLLLENKLEFVFKEFGVKYILGYSPDLTEQILAQAEVISIADSSIKLVEPELSRNKGWLMNLVK